MYLLIRWVLNAVALLAIAKWLPGVGLSGFYAALITILILGLINAILRPIALFLSFPITILTLGLFIFVVNGLMFWLASSIVKGFTVDGFWTAFLGALIYSLASWIISKFIHSQKEQQQYGR